MKFPCKQICPGCEKVTLVKQVNKLTTIMVKGKPIEVEDSFLECQECKLEFEDPRNPYDVLAVAYNQYKILYPDLPT